LAALIEIKRSRLHKKVRFLFRAREHAPARPDMRAPPVHHMLHAVHPYARAHARTASRSIALSARGRSLMLPSHLAGPLLCVNCEFVEPDHHAGGFQYLLLELHKLVLFVFSGSCAVQPVFVAARVGSRSGRVDPWAISGPLGPCRSIVLHVCDAFNDARCCIKLRRV